MNRLAQRDLRRFSEVVGALADRPVPAAALSNHMLQAVAELIPVDRVSYNEFDRRRGCLLRGHSLGEPLAPKLVASMNSYMHQHPGFNRPDSQSDWPAPNKISDGLSQRQFRSLGLYREHFQLYGIHYQLGIAFATSPSRKISFGLNRARRDFTEEERTTLALLRPHLLRAFKATAALEEMRAALELRDCALRGAGVAVMVLDANFEVAFCSGAARQLLQAYFGDTGGLPAALRRWLGARLPSEKSTAFMREEGRLIVRLAEAPSPESAERVVLQFAERPSLPSAQSLVGLGLTKREADVLLWLAQGKRNAEIALICDLHLSTVNTHLRSIFEKLGVETRTAAAAAAWEAITTARVQ